MDPDLPEVEARRTPDIGWAARRRRWAPDRTLQAARSLGTLAAVFAGLALITRSPVLTILTVGALSTGVALLALGTGRTARPRRALHSDRSWLTIGSWFARWSWRARLALHALLTRQASRAGLPAGARRARWTRWSLWPDAAPRRDRDEWGW